MKAMIAGSVPLSTCGGPARPQWSKTDPSERGSDGTGSTLRRPQAAAAFARMDRCEVMPGSTHRQTHRRGRAHRPEDPEGNSPEPPPAALNPVMTAVA